MSHLAEMARVVDEDDCDLYDLYWWWDQHRSVDRTELEQIASDYEGTPLGQALAAALNKG